MSRNLPSRSKRFCARRIWTPREASGTEPLLPYSPGVVSVAPKSPANPQATAAELAALGTVFNAAPLQSLSSVSGSITPSAPAPLAALALVFIGFVGGLNLSWTALAGGALVMVLARRDTHEVLKLVAWHLLLFFAALFVVVEGLNSTGLPDQIFAGLRGLFGSSPGAR